jgi:hypothetical protein
MPSRHLARRADSASAMKDRYPRTVAEFAEYQRSVALHCERCYRSQVMATDVLDATFGPEFDLYLGYRELRAQLYCPHCGAPRPRVSFFDPDERTGEVSFEDSVTRSLEFDAYVRASAEGSLPEPVGAPTRRRR